MGKLALLEISQLGLHLGPCAFRNSLCWDRCGCPSQLINPFAFYRVCTEFVKSPSSLHQILIFVISWINWIFLLALCGSRKPILGLILELGFGTRGLISKLIASQLQIGWRLKLLPLWFPRRYSPNFRILSSWSLIFETTMHWWLPLCLVLGVQDRRLFKSKWRVGLSTGFAHFP